MKTTRPLIAMVFSLAQFWAPSSHAMDNPDDEQSEIEFYSDENSEERNTEPGAFPSNGRRNENTTEEPKSPPDQNNPEGSESASNNKDIKPKAKAKIGKSAKIKPERVIRKIRADYKRQRRLDPRAAKALKTYIQPRVSSRPISDINDVSQLAQASPLHQKVLDFLDAGDEPLMVLFGPAGAGKSSYGRFLEKTLWEKYDKQEAEFVPIFIQLTKFYYRKDRKPIVEEYLTDQIGLSSTEVKAIRGKIDLVVILDGYEELGKRVNLYEKEKLESWAPLTIITSRAEVLDDPRAEFLFNVGREQAVQWHMAPLVEEEIAAYAKRFAASDLNRANWSKERYLQEISKLHKLLGNQGLPTHHPLALRVLLEAMPVLARQNTGAAVYREFMRRWLSEEALRVKQMISRRDGNLQMTADKIRQRFYKYSQDLSLAMFTSETDVAESRTDAETPHPTWGKFFSEETRVEQEGSPIMRVGQFQYRFVGGAIQQYLVAQRILEEILHGRQQQAQVGGDEKEDNQQQEQANDDRKEDDNQQQPIVKTIDDLLQDLDQSYLINQGMMTGKSTLIRFLAETVAEDRERLLPYFRKLIVRYKSDRRFTIAVANALEILHAAGVSFENEDLSGLCVAVQRLGGLGGASRWCGPDLTGIDLRQAKLDRADLRGTKLCKAKLNGASVCGGAKLDQVNLQGATLTNLKVDSRLTHDGVQGNFEKLTLEFLMHKEAARLQEQRLDQRIANLQTTVQQKNTEITKLKNDVEIKNATIGGLYGQISAKDSEINRMTKSIKDKDDKIGSLASDVNWEAKRKSEAKSEVSELRDKLHDILQMVKRYGVPKSNGIITYYNNTKISSKDLGYIHDKATY